MPAWSFQRRFRAALRNGLAEARREPPPHPGVRPKRQTIRAARSDGRDVQPGQAVRLWIAQRTPSREALGETPPVSRVPILLEVDPADGEVRWTLDGRPFADARAKTRLARRDGFESATELEAFFFEVHRLEELPFRGFLFRW